MNRNDAIVTMFGCVLLFALLASPAACTMHRHYRVQQAIASGASPIEAKCAIESETDSSPVCIVSAMKASRK